MNKFKQYHFIGKWTNGDPLVISSSGRSKKDAFINILAARKHGQFKYKKGDGFHVSYDTLEEHKGKIYGHTQYIVDHKGKVELN